MRRLKTAYIVACVLFLIVFHVLYTGGKIPFMSVNALFLFLAPAGYLLQPLWSYTLICLTASVIPAIFVYLYRADPIGSFIASFVFGGLLFGFTRYKNIIRQSGIGIRSILTRKEKILKENQAEFEKISAIDKAIREKEMSIVNLYETTKKMSQVLKFEEIFGMFGDILKENFSFRKCELLILKWADLEPRLDNSYAVWHDGRIVSEQIKDRQMLIKAFLDTFSRVAYFSKKEDPGFFQKVGGLDDGVKSFTAMSLLGEKQVAAILTIENLPKTELEKFVILSTQFGLEIKKVLLYEKVEELAITDGLTGLYVRRYFLERLREEFNRSRRHKLKFAFLMADIDNFKRCNDSHGHLVGDVILKDTAQLIKESVREMDLVARYGGEEFSVILPETDGEGAALVAERIRKRIGENIFKAYDEKLNMTVSIGLAVYPDDASAPNDLVEKADKALYSAKRSGKNVVCGNKKEYNS